MICEKSYITKNKLIQHKLNVHGVDERERANIRCREEKCEFICGKIDNLIHHLENNHQKTFEIINKTINSMEGNKQNN